MREERKISNAAEKKDTEKERRLNKQLVYSMHKKFKGCT